MKLSKSEMARFAACQGVFFDIKELDMRTFLLIRPEAWVVGVWLSALSGGCSLDSAAWCSGEGANQPPCNTPPSCAELGTCPKDCATGLIRCGDVCIDPASDASFCGASGDCAGANAGAACGQGRVCANGACADACPAGLAQCGISCVDFQSNSLHCGGCDMSCPSFVAGGTYACNAGKCEFECWPGHKNVDGMIENGCEDSTDLILWLDASFPEMGAVAVSKWEDRSNYGHDASQAINTQKPKLVLNAVGGRPAVYFDGTRWLEIPALQLFGTKSSELTLALVFQADNPSMKGFLLMQPQSNCTDHLGLGYQLGMVAGPTFGMGFECSGGATLMTGGIGTGWNRVVVTLLGSGSAPNNVVFSNNGAEPAPEAVNSGWLGGGSYGTQIKRLFLGAAVGSNGNPIKHHHGHIAEVIVITRALDALEKARLDKYFVKKYGNFN